MATGDHAIFVPILTVMPDYGNAPFLWVRRSADEGGVGGMLVDGCCWDESFPMSEALWREFADWAIAFDATAFYSDDFDDSGWDWLAFNARGLQLARWLKEEVGDGYRVVYTKPIEDPNHRIDEWTEIRADGSLQSLPRPSRYDGIVGFCQHIVSGGQTGADRAALDFAIRHGYTHGGWAPAGRKAEDGAIALRYQLVELPEGGYRQRTKRNVEDSDGTLVLNLGELGDGSLITLQFAQRIGKPALVVPLDDGGTLARPREVLEWLAANGIQTLNVAGPRESKRPGMHAAALHFLELMNATVSRES